MLVKDCISKSLPVLKRFDTAEYALGVMDDFKLKHLPLLSKNGYESLLSEKDLLALPSPSLPIGEPPRFAPCIKENGHLHEALALMARYGLTLLPVVAADGRYLGAITRDKLIDLLSELCHAETEGSVIVLELMPQDYALSDIARLVESNNAHILSLLSQIDRVTGRMHLTLKIDLEDASPVIRSFERFNYNVLYHFMERGVADELLQQRMDELLHYMNM